LRLSRKTEWQQPAEGLFLGLGQRVFATDHSDFSLLEVRKIEFPKEEKAPVAESSEEVESPAAEAPAPSGA